MAVGSRPDIFVPSSGHSRFLEPFLALYGILSSSSATAVAASPDEAAQIGDEKHDPLTPCTLGTLGCPRTWSSMNSMKGKRYDLGFS